MNAALKQAAPVWEDLVLREGEGGAAVSPAERRDLPTLVDPEDGRDAPVIGQALEALPASYLTHELRAPLTSVRSALDLLKERYGAGFDEEASDILELALRNTDRMAGLVTDILDYAMLEGGKMTLKPVPCRPRDLLTEGLDSMRAAALMKGVRLERGDSDESLPRVAADPRRIVQILVNLVSNALKFTATGGRVKIAARVGRHEHAGTVVFAVKDTGCGISYAQRERLFRVFQQAQEGACLADSSGLGLALAKAMVELHGGRIWVESWKGLGSTFRFSIPIVPEDLRVPVAVYSKNPEFHGLLVDGFRRLNAVLAYFV